MPLQTLSQPERPPMPSIRSTSTSDSISFLSSVSSTTITPDDSLMARVSAAHGTGLAPPLPTTATAGNANDNNLVRISSNTSQTSTSHRKVPLSINTAPAPTRPPLSRGTTNASMIPQVEVIQGLPTPCPTKTPMSPSALKTAISSIFGALTLKTPTWKRNQRNRLAKIEKKKYSNGTANYKYPPEEQEWDPAVIHRVCSQVEGKKQ